MQHVRNCGPQLFIISRKGGTLLAINDFIYRSNLKRFGPMGDKVYWECIHNRSKKCRSRLKTIGDDLYVTNDIHNHSGDGQRIELARKSDKPKLQSICWERKIRKFIRTPRNELLPSIKKINEVITAQQGKPVDYEYNSKGSVVKLRLDGHHFHYTYKMLEYTIYGCCNNNQTNNDNECLAKIVVYKSKAYYLYDKHTHSKPVKGNVSSRFSEPNVVKTPTTQSLTEKVHFSKEALPKQSLADKNELQKTSKVSTLKPSSIEASIKDNPSQFMDIKIKEEKVTDDESLEFMTETSVSTMDLALDAVAFREKIKQRLEKQLMRKVKRNKK